MVNPYLYVILLCALSALVLFLYARSKWCEDEWEEGDGALRLMGAFLFLAALVGAFWNSDLWAERRGIEAAKEVNRP